ncbi:6-phosphogluconolactonase [Paenibacillus sp. 79R4]|uniref:6-phosphogluconolactonase n=1 Tax=Paenibacillus sp. 79R4 TaxID=2212847 RepID=UPI0021179FB9|nr:6-phosphogluconolactonase [Paenibacillus sp. 79R4]
MMIKVFATEEQVADAIAGEMKEHLANEHPVFCLASGSTPQKSYMKFAADADIQAKVQQLNMVSLDEWVGISRESEGSCYQMLNQDLFSLVRLEPRQIEFFDGTAPDLEQECLRIDRFIAQHPITFSLMGVGMNGHIGLNEPGCPVLDHSSVVELSETTRTVAQKYFRQPTVLEKGITLGLNQVAGSKRVIVAITGARKAGIVRAIFTDPEAKLPAQELLGYEHIDFFLDSEAAKYIKQR